MSLLHPGFADPVAEAQACFRAVLEAMSRPGRVMPAGAGLTPPAPLHQSTAAVLLTLVDGETPLYLDPDCAAARDWIEFHCGAPFAATPEQAAFVLAPRLPDLASLPAGSDEGPEDSATVLLQVAGFDTGAKLRLTGPGLDSSATLSVDGLPADFVAAWAANHARFPRGIDLILCGPTALAGLPRSVTIEAC